MNLNFSQALELMKQGKRLSRIGWSYGLFSTWVTYQPGNIIDAALFWNEHSKRFAELLGGSAEVLPYFLRKTQNNKIQMGWQPDSIDINADDWYVVE
jgi:hypothetical protein